MKEKIDWKAGKTIPAKKKEDYHDAVWLDNPEKYPYLRQSPFSGGSSSKKPNIVKSHIMHIKDSNGIEKEVKVASRLIGYTKPKKTANYLYEGIFWWLKGYDIGMPYGDKGYELDNTEPIVIVAPSEAVSFSRKDE